MYNGLDITQSDRFITLSCTTCIRKILEGYKWHKPTHNSPLSLPMSHDKKYLRKLETSLVPTDTLPHATLQKEIGFSYRQVIDKILFKTIGLILQDCLAEGCCGSCIVETDTPIHGRVRHYHPFVGDLI